MFDWIIKHIDCKQKEPLKIKWFSYETGYRPCIARSYTTKQTYKGLLNGINIITQNMTPSFTVGCNTV